CAHRLLRKVYRDNRYIFITKADSNLKEDAPFAEEDLLGRIIRIKRENKEIELDSFSVKLVNRVKGIIFLLIFYAKYILKSRLQSSSS
ncbi:MAG: hypothetical protein N2Z79_01240, partial [Candidatus Omnitrophica bacterium]|nr:hypothetical protein [Candidatus Omnitrophota bacterium]